MITGQLTHPRIISALAAAGHGATALIADGHYSAATAVGPNAEIDDLMPEGIEPEFVYRFAFHDLARSRDLALCVVTGDSRRFANARGRAFLGGSGPTLVIRHYRFAVADLAWVVLVGC